MSAFGDGGATRPCDDIGSRVVVGAADWSGSLRRILGTVFRGAYEPFLRRRDADHVSARAGEMPSGREDMDLCTDKVLSKGRILQELTKAVKLVSDQPRPRSRTSPCRHARCRRARDAQVPRIACELCNGGSPSLLHLESMGVLLHLTHLRAMIDVVAAWTLRGEKRCRKKNGIDPVVISTSSISARGQRRSVYYVNCQSRGTAIETLSRWHRSLVDVAPACHS